MKSDHVRIRVDAIKDVLLHIHVFDLFLSNDVPLIQHFDGVYLAGFLVRRSNDLIRIVNAR